MGNDCKMKHFDNTIDKHIGASIRELRIKRRLDLDALALMVGIKPKILERIECGDHSADMTDVANLSHALKVPVDDLFINIPKKTPALPEDHEKHMNAERLVNAFVKIENSDVRHDLVSLIRSISGKKTV